MSYSIPEVFEAFYNLEANARLIVWNVRLPRVICGGLVGICLSLAGCILQGVMRNHMLAFSATAFAVTPVTEMSEEELVAYYLSEANKVVVTDTHVTFTDDSGRGEISIEKNPQNAAILYGSLACLWVEAGGKVQLAIGGDSNVTLYTEQIGRDIAKDEGVIVVSESNGGSQWDVETIIGAKPDLIVCAMSMKGWETISGPALATNIPIIGIQYDTVQDYLKWFKVFCNLNGQPELWDTIANNTAETIMKLMAQVPEVENPARVLILRETMKCYGNDCQTGQIVWELGGINVVEEDPVNGMTDSVELSMEEIYALNPDIILIPQTGAEGSTIAKIKEMLGDDPVWNALDAVKNDKVYYIEKGLFHNKPNQYYKDAYIAMFGYLYPNYEIAE